MQRETNSVLHHRKQNGWSKKSICSLRLLPKHIKQITKCLVLQVYVFVGNYPSHP